MNCCLTLLSLKNKFIMVNNMSDYKYYGEIIKNQIIKLRQRYKIGNYCGRRIFDIIEKLDFDGNKTMLFRLPFQSSELAGFVGYKNKRFSIYTNTNKNLGYEIFTAAHEIYHLLEHSETIKENVVLVENIENSRDKETELSEKLADMFAAELLMPEDDIIREFNRLIEESKIKKPDEALIIDLQHQYYVEYKAITKRLKEISSKAAENLKIEFNDDTERQLNNILNNAQELFKLTSKLGYSNELNMPSETKVYLPRTFLKITGENYKNRHTSLDDLTVLFSYCDMSPQDFGYEEEELSDNAKTLAEKTRLQLGSEGFGKK